MSGYRLSTYRAPFRGSLNGNSGPVSDQETRTTQGLGGENRITHSTLHRRVFAGTEEPRNSAILGSRQDHNRAAKAVPAAQSAYGTSIEVSYFNRLISRRSPLASVIAGGSSGEG
jgi:hypothetical protein